MGSEKGGGGQAREAVLCGLSLSPTTFQRGSGEGARCSWCSPPGRTVQWTPHCGENRREGHVGGSTREGRMAEPPPLFPVALGLLLLTRAPEQGL